jgi:hypothetical protein
MAAEVLRNNSNLSLTEKKHCCNENIETIILKVSVKERGLFKM